MMKNMGLIIFRESINKTQDEMAKILGVSSSFYSKIEMGARNPSFNFIKRFKEKFDCNIDEIFLLIQTT